jgi:hypothetical protein
MITSKRDIDTFRNIAKIYSKRDRLYEEGELVAYTTIDGFDYNNETFLVNVHPYNDKYIITIDDALRIIQSEGVYKNYSIDRTTHICKNDRERLFRKTSIAEEI